MKKNILIVAANFYNDFCDGLINSAKKELMNFKKIDIIKVPGVFEIPVTISRKIKKYDGVIALGCVIKGETPHFDFISKSTTDALMYLSIISKKPIGNGIITCLNSSQASVRINKGGDAAKAVLSILSQK
tara:strand:+ start:60 stop:449 length:390 start_codon:yes stop_codon:yes gene_type:complete